MASIKNSFTALIAVSLLALSSADCIASSTNGSERTTREILCSDTNPITKDTAIATFTTLCALLDSGVLTKFDDSQVDVGTFLNDADTSITFFAPTDAAFEKSLEAFFGLSAAEFLGYAGSTTVVPGFTVTQKAFYENSVAELLEQQILRGAKLTSQFECDETYETINLTGSDDIVPLSGLTIYSGTKGGKSGYYNGANRNDGKLQKTKCRGQADTFKQIGPGNVGQTLQPIVGQPGGIFDGSEFTSVQPTNGGNSLPVNRSNDIMGCNGVIQVIDLVILPEPLIPRGGKGTKGGYGYSYGYNKGTKSMYFGRALRKDFPSEEADHEANRENRRARLESLLVDANGNIEPLN